MRTHLRLLAAMVGVLALAACSDSPNLTTNETPSDVTGPTFVLGDMPCIGDFVWNDLNQNGCQDAGEPGLEGITVRGFRCDDDTEVASDVTDGTGYYALMFDEPGDYYVKIDLPAGWAITLLDAACGSKGLDNDLSPATQQTACTNLIAGELEKRIDIGLYEVPVEGIGCRMTGGGVDLNGNWDGTFERGSNDRDRYQFGGQAGANTALPPQPKGEWTHHQQRGPSGRFTFHAGTASAPEGTEIDEIICSDPGFCDPARPAPAKQIDFWGVGTFKNMDFDGTPTSISDWVELDTSLHWFEVNVDDAGEPGKSGKKDTSVCPDQGYGLHGGEDFVDCDCFDFYRITIHATDDPGSPIIYQVYGYIFGGNLQIHPLTGYDLH